MRGKWLCVIKPEQGISTAQAFSLVTPSADVPDLAEAVKLPINEWKQVITNDFEHSMFAIHPQLEALKQFLYGQGALYASMTGSGSAFYGIFPTEAAARTAAACAPTPFATFCRL